MRKLVHKTKADRDNEEQVRAILEAAWNCVLHEYPFRHPVDWYAVRRGSLVAVVELKCRKVHPDAYPYVLLSLAKWTAMREQAHGLHVPPLLVVRFGDSTLHYGDLTELDVIGCRQDGRNDRDPSLRPNGRELCVHLPIADMTRLHAASSGP